ncbi:MAG: terminase [Betaproteobacteria bacterium RIFCSPLOWO2_02_FULL_63_19]|nr:MAG: terminase [Betaproteobacteria bacterium RIFCSPLOWO2_02_FULL_63_19]
MIARYALDVTRGHIPACKWVKLACERHLADRKREAKPGYSYRFDAKAAAAFLARLERFPHVKGQWAKRKELIVLQPWQLFVLGVPFGWLRKRDGLRRFREIYIEVPRKNSKSTMAALVGLDMLMDQGEHGAEVYTGATTEKQAHEVFGPARLMLERSPEIREEAGAEIWAKAIVLPADNSKFWPVIGSPGDGASPSCSIVDEFHEHATADLVDTMVSGMGSREQPMLLIITTAGSNLASPCRDKHLEAQKVLQGTLENDELFAIIYGVDEGDDWTKPAAIRKANPNLGISVDESFLLAQQRQAVMNATYQNRFKTKHLNVWCGASVAGISAADWKRAGDPGLKLEQFKGESAIFSLDLASKLDICAFMQLFTRQQAGALHYYALGKYYIPEDTVAETRANQGAYRKWAAEGHLIVTEGAEIDFDNIREDVKEARSRVQAKEIVFDPWRATQLAHQLAKDGAVVVEMGQTARNMAQAFDELLSALKAGRFHHDGNPVLAWMAGNVTAKSVAKGVVVPSKEKPDQKIDGIVAIVMAIARAVVVEAEAPKPKFQFFALG